MGKQFNHQLCDSCYHEQRERLGLPRKEPIRMLLADGRSKLFDRCCVCGAWNDSGIYVRVDPARMPCNHWQEVLG